jgi:hemoglobin
MTDGPPTLFEWAGGAAALERLTRTFYEEVRRDPVLEPVFRHMDERHPQHVAVWLGEVFGGPPLYTEEHGGYTHMVSKHLGRALTEQQRRRWVELMLDAADRAALPDDPEFRSAFVAYIEWGTRLAVRNSQPGVTPPAQPPPVPRWGWGEAPPYSPGT